MLCLPCNSFRKVETTVRQWDLPSNQGCWIEALLRQYWWKSKSGRVEHDQLSTLVVVEVIAMDITNAAIEDHDKSYLVYAPKAVHKNCSFIQDHLWALTMYFLWQLRTKPDFFHYMWNCCATLTSQFCRWSIFPVGSSGPGCLAPRRATCRCARSAGWGLVLAPPVGEAPSPPSNNLVGSYWA